MRRPLAILLLVPVLLLLLEWGVEKRAAMPLWGWAEWKVFLVGPLWSASFWVSLVVWGAWWSWKGGHKRSVAWALGGLFAVWIGFAYFASYKYLADMYHLPNVHILQFTLLESANAWELTQEVLRWWHFLLAPLVLGALAWFVGTHFVALGLRLSIMRAAWRRLLLGFLTLSF